VKIAVVFNPRSGNAPSEDELRAAFRGLGVQVQTVPMDDQCEERLRIAARACDIFAAAGGDGTINAVAQALVDSGSGAALGVLPTGTANDLCRTQLILGRSVAAARVEYDGDLHDDTS
jgi:diacylglycerol kinase family enzyme